MTKAKRWRSICVARLCLKSTDIHAVLDDGVWNDLYEMKCISEDNGNENNQLWHQVVEKYIASLPEEAMLVSLDCHI